ncbi:hypothetical protein B0H21DRAFT_780159 [Amylocystis lapponica]|nr:hypothetical protein B0H21DRAFT_780159 [Amylocystis lapponica]
MSSSSLQPWDTTEVFKWTEPPAADFKFGQKVAATPEGKEWEARKLVPFDLIDTCYKLMISGIVPRPIAFVSSVSEAGVDNLAPYSIAIHSICSKVVYSPPLVSISVENRHPENTPKDTAANIKETKQFVVNIISEPFIQNANATCVNSPPDFSEWDMSGLTKEPSVNATYAFSMECELFQAIDIKHPDTGAHTATLILGHVKYVHVRNDVLNDRGNVDPVKFKPVGRLGDITFSRLGDGFRIGRPTWDTVKSHSESKY